MTKEYTYTLPIPIKETKKYDGKYPIFWISKYGRLAIQVDDENIYSLDDGTTISFDPDLWSKIEQLTIKQS
jgi:hypothetical protein